MIALNNILTSNLSRLVKTSALGATMSLGALVLSSQPAQSQNVTFSFYVDGGYKNYTNLPIAQTDIPQTRHCPGGREVGRAISRSNNPARMLQRIFYGTTYECKLEYRSILSEYRAYFFPLLSPVWREYEPLPGWPGYSRRHYVPEYKQPNCPPGRLCSGYASPPSYGGGTKPPSYGGGTKPPSYGGGTKPPSFGGQQGNKFGGQQGNKFGGQQGNKFGGQHGGKFDGQGSKQGIGERGLPCGQFGSGC